MHINIFIRINGHFLCMRIKLYVTKKILCVKKNLSPFIHIDIYIYIYRRQQYICDSQLNPGIKDENHQVIYIQIEWE